LAYPDPTKSARDQKRIEAMRKGSSLRHAERDVAIRSGAAGMASVGALAVGALAVGALAIGALAIGRLAVGRARFKSLEVDELTVGKLKIKSHDDSDPGNGGASAAG
jgi:hypothetical protein